MSKRKTPTNPFTVASVEISRLGMGGRVAKVISQPVYAYSGKIVAHLAGKLREVTPTGDTTATVDLLAKPVFEFPERPKRAEVADKLAEVGAVKLVPAKAAAPASSPKAKAAPKASPKAKAKAAPADTVGAAVAAIMGNAHLTLDQKLEALAALR